jgi:ectoine hydroxylase-related dioxygenase (phytanoyl-CoA dioxygenase family)
MALMTQQFTKSRTQQILGKAGSTAKRRLRRVVGGTDLAVVGAALAPSEALHENGFTVFRGLFPQAECAALGRALKREAGIRDGVKFTKVDSTNSYPTTREIVLDRRMLMAVRSVLGSRAKFLQVSDLHYLHDTAGWHRDSVHRAPDASDAPDWSDTESPFGVVKAILYLESDNAAMGIMAGSHLSPIAMDQAFVKSVESADGQLVINAEQLNRRLTAAQKKVPLAWKAEVGDVLVFDERMYHAGRRVDHGRVTANRAAPKFTLSLVFGADNHHSERMYSYFRYARKELSYRDLVPEFRQELAARGLVLSNGWGNFYAQHPQELRHVHLPDPTRLGPLIEEFSQPVS